MLDLARRTRRYPWARAVAWVAVGLGMTGFLFAGKAPHPVLAELYAQEVPAEGTETPYGMPLAWANAPTLARWYDEIELTAEEGEMFAAALAPLRAPCCDDNPLAACCCERGGLICNLVRTARGLGKYLIREGYSPDIVTQAMEGWLRFAHGDYYVARALVDLGKNPTDYGLFLPGNGSCYRGLCNAPLQEGGCGGMGKEVVVTRPKG